MAGLTKRQTQVKALFDSGKTIPEVAEELGISRNAVYKHSERLKRLSEEGNSQKPKSEAAPKVTKKRARKTTSKESLHDTPLEAVRTRRKAIEEILQLRQKELEGARLRAKESLDEFNVELSSLISAEAALSNGRDVEVESPKEVEELSALVAADSHLSE